METACTEKIPEAVAVFFGLLTCFCVLVGFIITIVTVIAFCRIFLKAGYHWALGLLILVPIANIILPLYLAFADWPVQKELRQLRLQQNSSIGA